MGSTRRYESVYPETQIRRPVMNLHDRFPPLRPESGELLHLDTLRFIASSGIIFHHSHEFFYPRAERAALMERTNGLGLFVQLFFIISGFVIAYIYTSRIGSRRDFGRFIQRRIGRLVPLHLATLAAAILIGAALMAAGVRVNNAPEMSAKCVATTALLLHSFINCGGIPFNGVSWSISVEMVMYLLFPVFVFLFARGKYGALLIGVALAAVFLYLAEGSKWSGWSTVAAPIRAIPMFVFGMGLCYARATVARIPRPGLLLALGMIALFIAMFNGMPALATILCFIVVALGVAADMSGRKSRIATKLAPLGQLTYSLYMIHWLVILVLLNGVGDKLLHLHGVQMIALALFTYTVIGLVGYLSYTLFETPARRWVDRLPLFIVSRTVRSHTASPESAPEQAP